MNKEHTNVKSKLVFEPRAWRALLKKGMRVIDCKPLRSDPTRTVLVFEDTPAFQEAFADVMAELKSHNETQGESTETVACQQ